VVKSWQDLRFRSLDVANDLQGGKILQRLSAILLGDKDFPRAPHRDEEHQVEGRNVIPPRKDVRAWESDL
jgi:hypothetical protein